MSEPITPASLPAVPPSSDILGNILSWLSVVDTVVTDLGGAINPALAVGGAFAGKLIAIAQKADQAHRNATGQPIDLSQHTPLAPMP